LSGNNYTFYLKCIVVIVIIIIIFISGAFIYENFSNIFGFLGLTSLSDKADRIRELDSELKRNKEQSAIIIGYLKRGNDALRIELSGTLEREREAAESLGRETEIHREMVGSIRTARDAIGAIREEAERVGRTAEELEEGIRILRQTSDKPDSLMEDNRHR